MVGRQRGSVESKVILYLMKKESLFQYSNVAYINYNSSDAYKVERALIYKIAGKTDDFITACEELYKKEQLG